MCYSSDFGYSDEKKGSINQEEGMRIVSEREDISLVLINPICTTYPFWQLSWVVPFVAVCIAPNSNGHHSGKIGK